MNAKTLQCYSCGAAASSDSPKCDHCGARLATVWCPSCFGMMFTGSKFCPHCGTAAIEWETSPSKLPCPTCKEAMLSGKLGNFPLHECTKCFGLWVDNATLEHVWRDAEQHSLPPAKPYAISAMNPPGGLPRVKYLPCPRCRQLMNRKNFALRSGVIIDVCREHGTWFDANELHHIVEFIRQGGLTQAREVEKQDLASARRRAASQALETPAWARASPAAPGPSLAGGLIWALFGIAAKLITKK